jgi:hypothetical protein
MLSVEFEVSMPCSQELATILYPELDQCSLHVSTLFFSENPLYYYLPICA